MTQAVAPTVIRGPLLKRHVDLVPPALVVLLAVLAWPAIGSSSTWITLTIAGLAMGMIIFIAASGLTLVFGLMDVLNFGHSLFIALGAFVATSVFGWLSRWVSSAGLALNLGAVVLAMLAAMAITAVMGLVFERLIVRPVYGQHLKQILVTIGGAFIGEELMKMFWGPAQIPLPPPEALRGSLVFGNVTVEKLRLISVVVGAVVLIGLLYTLNRTKIGLLIRAGVQDREMVESLGYRIRRLFVGVFTAGSALAGLGGCLWGMNQQIVTPQIGGQVNVLLFIVIIIGGLGSTLGCFVGALLIGLMTNYVGFLAPALTTFSAIGLMVAVLLWRPRGLFPVSTR